VTALFSSHAPAKIILSGEHAVLYGAPALATAVSCYANATIQASGVPELGLQLLNFRQTVSATLSSLRRLRKTLFGNYKQLLLGRLHVRDVLKRPSELFQYAFISLLDAFELELQEGAWVKLDSKIPVGCGMGSSAAVLVSFLKAVSRFLGVNVSTDWLFRLAREVEHLQHGRSSGLDTHLSLYGGSVLFQDGVATPVSLGISDLVLVNTGRPSTITGECVLSVRDRLGTSAIWKEFADITSKINDATKTQGALEPLIQANERLLESIGVVPEKVQQFIKEIENSGGAAKVCGAGAVRGDNGGIVAVFGNKPSQDLLDRYGYTLFEVQAGANGAS